MLASSDHQQRYSGERPEQRAKKPPSSGVLMPPLLGPEVETEEKDDTFTRRLTLDDNYGWSAAGNRRADRATNARGEVGRRSTVQIRSFGGRRCRPRSFLSEYKLSSSNAVFGVSTASRGKIAEVCQSSCRCRSARPAAV